ncbi:hypothetical protein [Oceanospirillum sanctuarii]|uniref:hypothetical protein n=1 Tax=Oceanospirillum sanctuarii TaxID=1434821 RepID=UPI000A38316B|nr:hypothetical protein [Oceanospirillum sanctuarii]
MNQDWILQKRETRRTFSNSTWVPLRASVKDEKGNAYYAGHVAEYFGCGSVAFPPEHRKIAEKASWGDIGIGRTPEPYAYEDGYYSPIDQYEWNDKEPIGIHLVFEYPQPVVGGTLWGLNPDLVVALRLIKEGNNWVRPEENFVIVAREILDEQGQPRLIEIKKEFLLDYLAARDLSLKLSYYRQRVENVPSLENSEYSGLESHQEQRDGGQYELLIRSLNDVFGGSWAMLRSWRTDVDEEEDAPIMGPETNENTDYEKSEGNRSGYDGVRVEGEFWRDEWVDHQGISKRIRGDADTNLPQFIVETDSTRIPSSELNSEYVGRWLWFRSSIVNELLGLRGFSLEWHTSETGSIRSTSGYRVHFGINSADFITVYAYDIARLPSWEQHIWAAHNAVPEGKISSELFDSQVKAQPASTRAVEVLFLEVMNMLEDGFRREFDVSLFSHELDFAEALKQISRFESKDQASLLRLAKEIVRAFSDRLNVKELRTLSKHENKDKLGSIKILQDILSQKVGNDDARRVFGPIVGAYDMRIGDAHPTSSGIGEALELAGIDKESSFLRQGQQLISNVGESIFMIGKLMFAKNDKR